VFIVFIFLWVCFSQPFCVRLARKLSMKDIESLVLWFNDVLDRCTVTGIQAMQQLIDADKIRDLPDGFNELVSFLTHVGRADLVQEIQKRREHFRSASALCSTPSSVSSVLFRFRSVVASLRR
jgi:hypothetical protein